MKIVEEHIALEGEQLILTNQRCIYWQREQALILSDLHVGKTAHFRRHGIPMPDDILKNDLLRLERLIGHFSAKQVFVVGDLFHAEVNSDIQTFEAWLQKFEDLRLTLIQGNHDKKSKHILDALQIEAVDVLNVAPFSFVHDLEDDKSDLFSISGHTHPGVLIKGKGRQKFKLPCYQISDTQLILPAFSLFTGLNIHNHPEGATFYAFTETAIFKF